MGQGGEHRKIMDSKYYLHLVLAGVGIISAILGFVVTWIVFNNVLMKGCDIDAGCQSMLFITTTFLSSKRIETSLGFPVGNDRDQTGLIHTPFNDPANTARDRTYQFGHFIECMYTARMADKTCPPSLTLNSYTACIQNTTLITGGLTACASFPSVGGYSHWPTAEEYISCVWNNPLLQNSESRRASQNVFRTCVEQTLWPFFEIPQTIDSPILFGSYNWGLLLLAGTVFLTSFVVYTSSPKEVGPVKRGEPQYCMRLGLLFSGTALVWNLIFFFIFFFVSFRGGGEFQSNGGVPTTFSTSVATLVIMGAAVLYFMDIVFRPVGRKFVAVTRSYFSDVATIECVETSTDTADTEKHVLMHATLPTIAPGQFVTYNRDTKQTNLKYDLTEEQVMRMYTPPLLAIWSDSYLADFCFVMGIAGATGQLSTDNAWLLFVLTLTYRLFNMIISRCISDAFTNNVKLDDATNQAKNKIVTRPELLFKRVMHTPASKDAYDVHLNTKVIGLSTQLAALFLYVAIIFLIFNANAPFEDYPVFRSYVILSFIIPEALRLLVHLFYQVGYNPETMGNVPWVLYNSFFAIWLWDVIVRFSYVLVIMVDNTGTPGTFDFLKSQTGMVMRDYVTAMAI